MWLLGIITAFGLILPHNLLAKQIPQEPDEKQNSTNTISDRRVAAAHSGDESTETLTPVEYYRMLLQAQNQFEHKGFDKAAELYDRLAKQNPNDAELWSRAGECHYQLKQ